MSKSCFVTILDTDGKRRPYLIIMSGEINGVDCVLVSPEEAMEDAYTVCGFQIIEGADEYYHFPPDVAKSLTADWLALTMPGMATA